MTKKQEAALKEMPQTGYAFNKEIHLHVLDQKPLTGITTILGVIAKPALIAWAANEVGKFIRTNCKTESEIYQVSEAELALACKAHAQRKKDAGDIGTEVHAVIEDLITEAISANNGRIESINLKIANPQVEEMVTHFVNWAIQNKVKFLESEKNLYSREMWTGGICDIVCEIDGKVWIADIKTASGIYPENMAQMAGYDLMLQEMGLYDEVAGYIVLNLRKDGTFEEKRSVSNEDNRKFFLACLEIYRLKEKIDNQII